MRDSLADRFGWSHKRAQSVSALLFADPALFAIAGIEIDGSGQYGAATPTPSALALLVIAALIEQPASMAWHSAAQLHWHAQVYSPETDADQSLPRPRCPISGQVSLGRMLTAAIAHPAMASRIIRVEVSRGGPVWTLWSRRPDQGPVRTLFVAATGRALREALEDLPHSAYAACPGRVLFELATVLARLAGKRGYNPPRG